MHSSWLHITSCTLLLLHGLGRTRRGQVRLSGSRIRPRSSCSLRTEHSTLLLLLVALR
jgi:hypothetical protein